MRGFDTDRLIVRDWSAARADPVARRALADGLRAILTPPVLRHLPEPVQLAPDDPDLSAWMEARAAGASVGTIAERDSTGGAARLIGLVFVMTRPEPEKGTERRIGYLLGEAAWGRGLATELVRGLAAALHREGIHLLRAGVAVQNPASMRVLQKAGFVREVEGGAPDIVSFALQMS